MGAWALDMAWAQDMAWALEMAWAVDTEWAVDMVAWEVDMVWAWALVWAWAMVAWEVAWTWTICSGPRGAPVSASTRRGTLTMKECTALLAPSTASQCAWLTTTMVRNPSMLMKSMNIPAPALDMVWAVLDTAWDQDLDMAWAVQDPVWDQD